jgi:hypothetical protein
MVGGVGGELRIGSYNCCNSASGRSRELLSGVLEDLLLMLLGGGNERQFTSWLLGSYPSSEPPAERG